MVAGSRRGAVPQRLRNRWGGGFVLDSSNDSNGHGFVLNNGNVNAGPVVESGLTGPFDSTELREAFPRVSTSINSTQHSISTGPIRLLAGQRGRNSNQQRFPDVQRIRSNSHVQAALPSTDEAAGEDGVQDPFLKEMLFSLELTDAAQSAS